MWPSKSSLFTIQLNYSDITTLFYKGISPFHDDIPEFDSILSELSLSGKCPCEICDTPLSPWMVFDQWMLTPLRFPATASNRWPHLEADCLNYEILLAKLHVYRIRGLSEDWFGLIELTEDRKSKQCHLIQLFFFFFWLGYIETWVSHWSILRSLFFIIYINGLPLRMNIRTNIIFWWY